MAASLGHRERVLRSLERKDIDRVPVYFRAEPPVRERLKRELELRSERELAAHFGSDSVQLLVKYHQERFRQSADPRYFYDMFGNKYQRVYCGEQSIEAVVEPVLQGAQTPADLGRVAWPEPGLIDMKVSRSEAREARESGLAVYGGVWASIFTQSRAMLGEEDYLTALIANPELISALVERLTDCYLELDRAYLDSCAPYLDVLVLSSDFGTQDSLFISPQMFRYFFKPNLKRLAALGKSYGLKVFYHTCGAVVPLIPDLIDCGIEILDPIQVSAAGMSPESLARSFKGWIAFHGGISTQTTLPKARPEEVREEVRRTISALGPLGYIVCPDQDLMGDIPTANIEALYKAAREYKL